MNNLPASALLTKLCKENNLRLRVGMDNNIRLVSDGSLVIKPVLFVDYINQPEEKGEEGKKDEASDTSSEPGADPQPDN